MAKEVKKNRRKYFMCSHCRFLYKEKKSAEEHEKFCKEYNTQISEANEDKSKSNYKSK